MQISMQLLTTGCLISQNLTQLRRKRAAGHLRKCAPWGWASVCRPGCRGHLPACFSPQPALSCLFGLCRAHAVRCPAQSLCSCLVRHLQELWPSLASTLCTGPLPSPLSLTWHHFLQKAFPDCPSSSLSGCPFSPPPDPCGRTCRGL